MARPLWWSALLALACAPAAAQVGTWTTGSITMNGDTNNFVSVTTDSSGVFHGAWRPDDGATGFIQIGVWNGVSWTNVSSFNTSSDSPNIFDSFSDTVSLAMDSAGDYHVAFLASRGGGITSTRGVFYAKYDVSAATWSFSEVQTGSHPNGWNNWYDPEIDVDSSDQPHLSFLFSNADDAVSPPRPQAIRYAVRNGGSWTITNVDTTDCTGGTCYELFNLGFALDAANKAHFCYGKERGDVFDADLVYATNAAGAIAQTILKDVGDGVSAGPGVGDADLKLDAAGKVHIAYSVGDFGAYTISHFTNAGGSFVEGTALAAGDHGFPIALGINGMSDLKVIAYSEGATNPTSVRAVTREGTNAWQDQLVWFNANDDFGTGNFMSAVMNNSGDIMILFHRNSSDTGTDRRVMFAFGRLGAGCVPIPEICNNGADDDCDGMIDCTDGDCGCSANCDVTLPSIACPANIVVGNNAGQCSAVVNFTPPTGTDNCPGASTTRTAGLAPGAAFPVGTTTETYRVTDAAGNMATCSFTVTVNDTDPPTFASCPANITVNNDAGQCSAVVNFTAPVGLDNCAGVSTARIAGLAPGSTFPIGATTVTYRATDAAGNVADCSFTVTVNDTENPVIACPADISVESDAGQCSAVVNFTPPVGTDNCAGLNTVLTTGLTPGSAFPVGATVVTYRATDAAGNFADCSFTVTVNDTEDPVIACPADIAVDTDPGQCSAMVTYATPVGTDNCAGATTVRTAGLGSGSAFPIGTTTETYEVTDAAGNTAVCSFTVAVNDAENPVITCPADITVDSDPGQCSAVVSYTTPVGTDNCPGAVTVQTAGPGSGSAFPIGVTTETYEVADAAGNTVACSFTVTVNDSEAPVVDCSGVNPSRSADPGECGFTMPDGGFDATASDNCSVTLTNDFNGGATLAGATFPVGTTSVTWTATDPAGNVATCAIDIVITDDEAPTITCPGEILGVDPDGATGAVVNYAAPTTSDNCPSAVVTQTAGLGSGAVFPFGVTTETYTVTDASGNTAACSFTVEVLSSLEVAARLIGRIDPMVGTTLERADGRSLVEKLDRFILRTHLDQTAAACDIIAAFVSEVNALIQSGALTSEEGQPWIDTAIVIQIGAGCAGLEPPPPQPTPGSTLCGNGLCGVSAGLTAFPMMLILLAAKSRLRARRSRS